MRKRAQELTHKYNHIIMPTALIGGFIFDIFTLNRIDQVFDNAILITHLLVVTTTIALLFSRETFFGKKFLSQKRVHYLQTAMVFSFGALFSGFIIFYTRSGSLLTSWPFILSMLLLMLGTEFRKRYFERLTLQIVIFYLAIISWTTFFIPVVVKEMGDLVFLLSTFISLVFIAGFFLLLRKINPVKFKLFGKKLIRSVAIILFTFNLLYFLNIIPPIPLSLKYQAVYYDVERLYPGYAAQYEKTAWYNFWRKRSRDMYWRPGEDIFMFTQVFAPTNLETDINHEWEFYDEANRRWITKDTITLSISGGRAEGYRGFSRKTNLEYGTWRVKTSANRKDLGVLIFEVEPHGPKLRKLVTEEL
ncbi:MAG: DUF2914 domain-containing protein [Candidatus Pacebacteria bacterium]|nr:DUF2914 domain-containing protein [Candidatus Paceibacterota bacterium]